MFKNLLIAILVAVILTWCFGEVIADWGQVLVSFDHYQLDKLSGGVFLAALGVILLVLGFFLAISMIGVLFFVAFVVVGSVVLTGVVTLWPVVLMAIVLIWLVKDSQSVSE